MIQRVSTLLTVMLLLCSVAALGATLRVPTDYSTIQAAVDAAAVGDVILINPGTYAETVTIQDKEDLVIKGNVDFELPDEYTCAPPIEDELAAVTIRGSVYIVNSQKITLEALTITEGGLFVQGSSAYPVSDITIRYCVFVGNRNHGIRMVGYYSKVQILSCIVSHNGRDGIYLDNWGKDIVVENCDVTWNGQITATGVGIRVGSEVENLDIRNNCFVGNPFADIHPS